MKSKMPDIEKLTDVQRNTLLDLTLPHGEGKLALRIIDAQASALAEARQQTVEQVNAVHEELTAALAETRAECERFRAQAESWERGHDYAWDKLAASEAECERLRAELAIAWDDEAETKRANAAESRLATANALLKEWRGVYGGRLLPGALARQTDAHLAGQPVPKKKASNSALEACDFSDLPHAEGQCRNCEDGGDPGFCPRQEPVVGPPLNRVAFTEMLPTRTEAEQRVLDAVAAASDDIVRLWVSAPAGWVGFYHDLGVAELARRGLKP